MIDFPEGNAIVYCEGAFNTPNGKTAHGLIRFTRRYRILSVIDSRLAGRDAGTVLDGETNKIPVHATLDKAFEAAKESNSPPTFFIIGLAPDGGRLSFSARNDVKRAIQSGLNIDSGLHDFLSEDSEIAQLASRKGVGIRDIRKPPLRNQLHFFSGKIEEVKSLKIAVLGTDSAIGKRTTAWIIVQAFQKAGYRSEMIGTGQTAWMQGAQYSIILDSLINDFVSGEIEHVIWRAWKESLPDVIVIEGQGSLMNPAYPGGFEIVAAGRPDLIVLQHAPARRDYDGFPGYPIHPLARQIEAIECISGKSVAAIAVNHEYLRTDQISLVCDAIEKVTGLPAYDPLFHGAEEMVKKLLPYLKCRPS